MPANLHGEQWFLIISICHYSQTSAYS